jgi:ribonuclease PH
MKPSKLVETGWSCMSFHRASYGNTEVLAVVYAPFESRMTAKSNFSKGLVEVVLSDVNVADDHSEKERIISDLFSSVIQLHKYPYLTVMICIQIFVKDFNFFSACINSAFQAVKKANLALNCSVVAKDFLVGQGVTSLAIVPKTDEILMSFSENVLSFEEFERILNHLASEEEAY